MAVYPIATGTVSFGPVATLASLCLTGESSRAIRFDMPLERKSPKRSRGTEPAEKASNRKVKSARK